MKEKELRSHSTCSICGRKIVDSGLPLFWTVEINRYGIDVNAVRRITGLQLAIGVPLADVMGADEDIAKPVMEAVKLTVCEDCATESALPIAALALGEV